MADAEIVARPALTDAQLNALFAAAWPDYAPRAFGPVLARSLTYCGAFQTGELVGFVPIAKESSIRFRRPALGVVRAAAELSDDEVERVSRDALESGKGEFVLQATLTDAQGEVVGWRASSWTRRSSRSATARSGWTPRPG